MKFHLFLTAAAGSFALAACGGSEESNEVPPAAESTAPAVNPTADLADPSTPQGFVDTAAASDMYEIEAARIAQEKAQGDQVKQFAQMMIDDHTTSSQNLQSAAGQVSGVTVAPRMTAMHQQMLTELRNTGTEAFDGVYKRQQIEAHQQTLNALQNYAQSGTEAPLKSFAASTAPVVEMHLGMANELP
jgi:putative membrane protein